MTSNIKNLIEYFLFVKGNETFCFMDCKFEHIKVHFNYKYMLILDGEVTPWMR